MDNTVGKERDESDQIYQNISVDSVVETGKSWSWTLFIVLFMLTK